MEGRFLQDDPPGLPGHDHLFRLLPGRRDQPNKAHPRRHCNTGVVSSIPHHRLNAFSLGPRHERSDFLPLDIVNRQRHRGRARQGVADLGDGLEGIGKVLFQHEVGRRGGGLVLDGCANGITEDGLEDIAHGQTDVAVKRAESGKLVGDEVLERVTSSGGEVSEEGRDGVHLGLGDGQAAVAVDHVVQGWLEQFDHAHGAGSQVRSV